jgi:iron complex outermembrane recepter protein
MNTGSPPAAKSAAFHSATASRALALCCSLVAPCIAVAQNAAPGALEEVVVTAERRAMALQDTPISIVALSTETLESKNVEDLFDVARITPNLAIQGGRGSGNNTPTFAVRGISGGGGATSERGVGLYIDGIYVPRTSGSVFKVFDIERIEVLRGPQGTLFGRNSTGGAVRVVTKQPGPDFESYVRGTAGNFDRRDISAMVNIPVSDSVAVRAQGAYLHQDGYVRRGTQELGGSEDWLGRVQVAIELSENAKLTLGGLYSTSEETGSPSDIISWDMSPDLNFQGNYADWVSDALQLAGQPRLDVVSDPRLLRNDFTMPDLCFLDDFDPDWDKACEQYNNNDYLQVDANFEWNINEAMKLTSLSGYAYLDHEGVSDWQMLGTERRPDDVNSKVFYQEVQLNAELFGGRIDLVTGLTYFREESSSSGYNVTRRGTSAFPTQSPGTPPNNDAGLFITANGSTSQTSDSYGWFNSATWHATDKMNLTVGARLAHDKKDYEQTRLPGAGATNDFVPAPGTDRTTVTSDNSWTEVDWRGTLDYHFTDDHMAYATVSKAYRAGQYSYSVLQNVPGPAQSGDFIKPIPPETVINYELGARTTWFDGRLRVNPTVFYMQWTDRQGARQINCLAEGTVACPTGFRILVVNSGDVDLEGLELDAQLAVTDNLMLDGAVGITRFDLKDPVANGGPNLFPDQASPSWNVGASYSIPMTQGASLAFNANYSYTGSQETHASKGTDSSYTLPSYDLVNARITWTAASKRNVVTLFANNLLDDTYATYATKFGGGFWDNTSPTGPTATIAAPPRNMVSVVRGRPRDFGVTYQHNF